VDVSVEIRRARPDDASALVPLIDAHARFERQSAACDPAQLHAALAGTPAPLLGWVAARDRALVGYATATIDISTWTASRYLHLDCLFVAAPERGRRLGVRLLAAVVDHCRAAGLSQIEWQTPAWNDDAIRFYARSGATTSAKQRFSLWPDDFSML
jgi:GNAT superfamily N-acetyltransferase